MKRLMLILSVPLFVLGCEEDSSPKMMPANTAATKPVTAAPANSQLPAPMTPSAPANTSTPTAISPPAPAPSAVAPANSSSPTAAAPGAVVPAPKAYFETKSNGKTYVFGSFASWQTFNKGDTTSLKWTEKTGLNGVTVELETDSGQLSDSLWGEYQKNHPRKA